MCTLCECSCSLLIKLAKLVKPLLLSIRSGLCFCAIQKLFLSSQRKIFNCRLIATNCQTMRGESKVEFRRLPATVTPINYDIKIEPNLKSFTFTATETIKIQVNEETNKIVLNALELEIICATFTSDDGKSLEPQKIEMSVETETASFHFNEPLSLGTGSLKLDFSGIISDKLRGFYRSKYVTADGQERYVGCTHFEATDARRAFACWDEPALKATFDITLVVPSNRLALSNMDIISDTVLKDNQDLKEVKFATTPIMSTYLVAYVVGEFDYVEDKTTDGVTVRVYTPVGKKEQGLFGLEVAVKALPFYKDYFDIAYPLSKMDLIAIADFGGGAMENWGLVTYREACLLVDPQNTSSNRKQWIALTVAHELAHQWFGNLVTMEWWTHLWLNEGFASFIEYLCVDYLFPEYQIWTQFVANTYMSALELDALHNSHPIEVPVGHPSEVDEIFDDISYDKGATVIRMLHRFIGDELFRKGMNLYLTRYSYKNTITEDLWAALEEASGKPVGAVMSTWTKQKGFPVISVSSRTDGNSRILTLTQEKFCADGKLPASEQNVFWMIPISVSKASSPGKIAAEVLMETKTVELVVPDVQSEEWVKLNPSAVGVYRVQYSPELLDLLLPAITDKTLPPLDRLGLQNDLFALVQSGRTSTVEILKLMDAFINEDDYTVWNSINACVGKLNILLSHTELLPLFHEYGRQLFSKVHSRLGWEPIKGETHLDNLLRSLVINRLVTFNDPAVISQSKQYFESYCNGTYVIPPDLRTAVYRAVAADCDDKIFDALFKLYRETDLHEEKDRLSRGLGNVNDPNRIAKSEVRTQDTVFVVISVALTKSGRDLALQFFKDNKDEFRSRYESGFLISRLIKYIAENYASEEKAQELETFFTQNPFPGTERTVQQALETVRLNAEWLARDTASIQNYFSDRF